MKAPLLAAALILLGPVMAVAAPASGRPVCLDTMRIRSTTEPNDRTILFHMDDGTVWANHLRAACVGIRFDGFAYEPTPPHQICANLQTIRVLRTGSVCMLGEFEKQMATPKGGQ